jgi:hypothetical protein
MALPGLVAAKNLADVADRERAWDNLGVNISARVILDQNARDYIAAVEAADAQNLEPSVQFAINDFIVGCKADGIWNAIKASCILAGARTLDGALVPLVGTAPTNNNFVPEDYSRITGLQANGSTKWLQPNRLNNADPRNDKHSALYVADWGSGALLGTFSIAGARDTLSSGAARNRTSSAAFPTGIVTGFTGTSRNSSAGFDYRNAGATQSFALESGAPAATNIQIFRDGGAAYNNGKISFYSLGESLNIALLDARVTALMNAIAAAIP